MRRIQGQFDIFLAGSGGFGKCFSVDRTDIVEIFSFDRSYEFATDKIIVAFFKYGSFFLHFNNDLKMNCNDKRDKN